MGHKSFKKLCAYDNPLKERSLEEIYIHRKNMIISFVVPVILLQGPESRNAYHLVNNTFFRHVGKGCDLYFCF